jgi:opacity protein-like surface antigen
MKRIFAVAFAGIVATSATAHAADLFGTVPPTTVFGQPTEITSGWYLRGDFDYGWGSTPTIIPSDGLLPPLLSQTVINSDGLGGSTSVKAWYVNQPTGDASHNVSATRGNNQNIDDPSFDIGVGYRFDDHLRMDATYSYWSGAAYSTNQRTLCPGSAAAVSNTEQVLVNGTPTLVSTPVGYSWNPNICNGYVNATQYNQTGMVNGYYDIVNYYGFTPYIGGGLGLNFNIIQGHSTFYNQNDGSGYAGNTAASGAAPLQWVVGMTPTATQASWGNAVWYAPLSKQPNITFGQQDWNRTISAMKINVAYSAMVGFSYQFSHNLALDVGYRFLDAPIGGLQNYMQDVRIGVRLMAE